MRRLPAPPTPSKHHSKQFRPNLIRLVMMESGALLSHHHRAACRRLDHEFPAEDHLPVDPYDEKVVARCEHRHATPKAACSRLKPDLIASPDDLAILDDDALRHVAKMGLRVLRIYAHHVRATGDFT